MSIENIKALIENFKNYAVLDKTKYAVVSSAPLTQSGKNEILARFEFKYDAEDFMRAKGLKLSRGYYIRRIEQ